MANQEKTPDGTHTGLSEGTNSFSAVNLQDSSTETQTSNQPTTSTTNPRSDDELPPPKPARPMNPLDEAEATLKEAFPTIDAAVVKAVLTASGGKVEPAFNALLGMSDPDALKEPTPPPQPVRSSQPLPVSDNTVTSTPQNQLEADELYARQLAEHYSGGASHGQQQQTRRSVNRDPPLPPRKRETGLKPNEQYEEEHSFLDDDLPVIKENIKRTFFETQSKVNRWVADLRKKIDGEDEPSNPGYNTSRPQQPSYGSRRSGDLGRRSGERVRYDADPKVLGDDLSGLELRDDDDDDDDDDEIPPRQPPRPLANPNLFKSSSPSPSAADSRKVSFRSGTPEEIRPGSKSSAMGGKPSKWEPLSTVDPAPMADNDPFSLGDSDDEREMKTKQTKSDDDPSSMQHAAAEAMADNIEERTKDSSSEAQLKKT
ncbi:MAG: ubiquitin-binding protein cue5 [Peltula sp. TS41687]|nr:MAG: ubiquitin-binding protein cue5 [Peltula sp. TS41687]